MTDETETDYARAWRPDKDDPKTVKGHVLDVVLGPDFGWGRYPIVTIRQEDGEELAIHAQATILRSEMAERDVGKGDDVEVTYLGKRAPKSGAGKPYHVYKVTGGKQPAFSWNSDVPERQVDQADPPIQSSRPADPDPMPASADDDDLPFLWRPVSHESVKITNWNPFGR